MKTTLTFKTLNDTADLTFNQLLGINNSGEIAGYFGNGDTNPNKGYTLNPPYGQAQYTNENFLGSVQTQVTGINSHGVTSGFWVDGAGDNYGFVKLGNQYITAIDPNAPAPTATAPVMEQFLGINDHDVAVGFYADAKGRDHGFTYDVKSGSFNAVTVSGFKSVTATAIDNAGDVAGFVSNDGGKVDIGFIKQGNAVTLLSGPTGATSVMVLGDNNQKQVVGSFTDKSGATHGFLYDEQAHAYTQIDDPNGVKGPTAMTVVNGLNDKGQLVGFYLDANGNTDGMLVTVSHKA